MSYGADKGAVEHVRDRLIAQAHRALELASKIVDWPTGAGSFAAADATSKTDYLATFDTALDSLEATVAKMRTIYTNAGGL